MSSDKNDWTLEVYLAYFNELLTEKVANFMCRGCLGGVKWANKDCNIVQCSNRRCRKKQALLKSAPFYNSKLTISLIQRIIYHIIIGDSKKKIYQLYGVDKKTVKNILILIGDLIINYNKGIKIGGNGVIVEVDESKFGKRKYNRGHHVEGSWVVGAVERSKERKIFLERIEKRDSESLQKLISEKINTGTIIYTDCWRGYNGLNKKYAHFTVNHSQNFVDPITKVHTNTIEGTWFSVKAFIKRRYFSSRHLKYYLAIYQFLRNEGKNAFKILINMLL